jgi:hypothetical protein
MEIFLIIIVIRRGRRGRQRMVAGIKTTYVSICLLQLKLIVRITLR